MSDDITPAGFVMDRALQLSLLQRMRTAHPLPFYDLSEEEFNEVVGQLSYLEGHGLCEAGIQRNMNNTFHWTGSAITSAGLDFLEQDGGLGAILNVVTVKLHADTIRDLLAAKVDASDLPEEKKSAIKEHLKKLPGAALQAATSDLVKIGLDHLPNATHWLHTLAGLV